MLQLLTARECGLDPPWLLPRVYQHQRYAQVELAKGRDFTRGHKSAVASLDIDRQGGRYLISGGKDKKGSIVIHDLCPTAMVSGDTTGVNTARDTHPIVAKATVKSVSPTDRHQHASQDHSHAVSTIQWYPHDTGLFTTSSTDRTLQVWDTNQLAVVDKFSFSKIIYTHSMAATETHSLIAVGGEECKVTLCNMESGSTTHKLQFHSKPVLALSWSPLSDHLLASAGQDNAIALWDIRRASGPLFQLDQHNGSGAANTSTVVTAHDGGVNGLCFTSDGLFLVSFGLDNAVRLWDTFAGKNTLINYGPVVNTLPKQSVQFYCTPHTTSLQPLAVVPSSGQLVLLELMTGKKLKSLSGHFGGVHCITGHPIEQEFYSGGTDRNILAWAPPSAATKETGGRRGHASSRTTTGVHEDAWSSDED